MFVDLHNHILPGIDDGAQNLGEALAMARLAVADGTEILAATPHRFANGRTETAPDWVAERVRRLQDALDQQNIPLTLVPGVEIKLGPRVAEDLAAGRVGTLGGGRWALIEPPFDRIPRDGLANIRAILEAGFRIVLAHPERCAEIQRHLHFVEACADLGVVFQLTTGSVLGRFGREAQRTALAILHSAREWPLVIASDTHG